MQPGDITALPRRDMTRVEAARYITDHWFPCSPKTLAKLAVLGGGPSSAKPGASLYTALRHVIASDGQRSVPSFGAQQNWRPLSKKKPGRANGPGKRI
jgi:hypothetical protein